MANPLTRAFLRRFRVNPIFWYFQVFMIWLPVTLCFGFPVTLLLHNSRFTCVLLPEALKYGKPLQVAHRDDNARAMLRKIRKSSNFHTELKLQFVYFHYWNLGVQSQKLNFANSSNGFAGYHVNKSYWFFTRILWKWTPRLPFGNFYSQQTFDQKKWPKWGSFLKEPTRTHKCFFQVVGQMTLKKRQKTFCLTGTNC